jgi:hypothetical protein
MSMKRASDKLLDSVLRGTGMVKDASSRPMSVIISSNCKVKVVSAIMFNGATNEGVGVSASFNVTIGSPAD